LNFCRAMAAKSRSDAMTIAQPFMAGSSVNKMKKSREGRQKNGVAVRNGGRAQAPFVPGGTLDDGGQRVPAMNGWAIFRGDGARPKTATGTGALPSKVPAGRPPSELRGGEQSALELSRIGAGGGCQAERA
jgi:hypothetical protein